MGPQSSAKPLCARHFPSALATISSGQSATISKSRPTGASPAANSSSTVMRPAVGSCSAGDEGVRAAWLGFGAGGRLNRLMSLRTDATDARVASSVKIC